VHVRYSPAAASIKVDNVGDIASSGPDDDDDDDDEDDEHDTTAEAVAVAAAAFVRVEVAVAGAWALLLLPRRKSYRAATASSAHRNSSRRIAI
jgi:hypothetical protein